MTSASESDHCYFWYDNTAPTTGQPAPSDFDALSGNTLQIGGTGHLTLTAADIVPSGANYSGVDHFAYSTTSASAVADDQASKLTATVSGANASATLTLTPTVWGINYVYVAAVDNAGNVSSTVRTFEYYVRDNPSAPVDPSDVDGDGSPDILAASTDGTLLLYPTMPGAALTAGTAASTGGEAPDGTTWAHTLIAHRSTDDSRSPSGGRVDDLYALKNGVLDLYTNNLYNGGLDGTGNNGLYYSANHKIPVSRPLCTYDDTACASYDPDWSTTTQMIAPGDIDGDGIPDLITVETTASDTGELWFFHGGTTTGRLTDPRRIGASGWNNWRIMAPGDSTGDGEPDIWAAAASGDPGALRLYPLTRDCSTSPCGVTVGAPIANTAADWGPDHRILLTSPGDVDRADDGTTTCSAAAPCIPDLYSVYNAGSTLQLWENSGTSLSPTSFTVAGHVIIDDGSRATPDWTKITNIA